MAAQQSGRPLKVVIVGGAGAMGRWAVRGVARLGSASRLLVADLDTTRAKMIADEVGGPCTVVELDAKDPQALRETFADCDVVLNTMGPFSLFARPILEAAIESGCDYLDIDDDWQSTVEAFEFDARARERGLRVVKGIGGSPGISNLCAMVAARRLDKVDEIVTGWSLSGAVVEDEPAYLTQSSGPSAAVEHWLIQLSGSLRAWRKGAEQDVAPLQAVDLDYPGIGAVRTYTVGHPEAVTLPRYIDGVVTSMNVMSGPEWIFDHARSVAAAYDAGTVSLAEGARQLENHPAPPAQRGPRDPLASVWALARGTRGGQPLAVSVQPASRLPGKMGATGTALAIGLELLRRGGVNRPGVHAPEGVIDPDAFFELYAGFVATPVSPADVLIVRELPDASLTIAEAAAER